MKTGEKHKVYHRQDNLTHLLEAVASVERKVHTGSNRTSAPRQLRGLEHNSLALVCRFTECG